MNKMKLTALLLSAVMGCGFLTGCGDKKITVSSTSESSEAETSETQEDTTRMDDSDYKEIVLKDIEFAERSDEPLEFGELGEEVTPNAEDQDGDLGSYRESSDGTKLYFNDDEFPAELVQTLEKYFISFAESDFTMYTRCAYPDYLDRMDKYLQDEYGYDIKNSFATQCSGLATTTNGKFKISRIKIDVPAQYQEDKDNLEAYFENFTDILGDDYYEKLKKDVDNIYDGEFYVMAEDRMGNETLLISAYEIVFVEKDGRYYVFG
ncbi:MAG: hypothetical protein IJ779_09125 [Ruminococcus sp.]|nr:hypothetical protein [Ruminococcus sp.]